MSKLSTSTACSLIASNCNIKTLGPILMLFSWIIFTIAIYIFAYHQNIWIDESTQLSGITLDFPEMLRWLAGEDSGRFGVPGDRMPPLSYFFDWAWYRFPWSNVLSLRLLHGSILLGGLIVLGLSLRTVFGWPIALGATALLTLSTRMIQTAVELRAYPFFVALSCVALAISIRIVTRNPSIERRHLVALTMAGISLSYAHFFGAIAFYSLCAGLLWHFRRNRSALVNVLTTCAAVGLTIFGILPFALASSASSDSMNMPFSIFNVLTYFAQLCAGSADLVSTAGAAAIFLSVGALAVAGMITLVREQPSSPKQATLVLLVATLSVGIITTLLISFLANGFDALKPTYSLWMIPIIAVLLAVSWAQTLGFAWWDKAGRHIAMCAAIFGTFAGTAQMLLTPTLFIHGPHRILARYMEAAPGSLLLYETPNTSGYGYFPLRYSGRGRIEQWLVSDGTGQTIRKIQDGPNQPQSMSFSERLHSADRIVVVAIRLDQFDELRRYINGASTGMTAGYAEERLQQNSEWTNESVVEQAGYYSTRISVWRRHGATN